MEIAHLTNLSTEVARLLKSELGQAGTVTAFADRIIIHISHADFERRLGNLLQQIYRVVDQHFPVRSQHISLIIRDRDALYENVFKLWKTASDH